MVWRSSKSSGSNSLLSSSTNAFQLCELSWYAIWAVLLIAVCEMSMNERRQKWVERSEPFTASMHFNKIVRASFSVMILRDITACRNSFRTSSTQTIMAVSTTDALIVHGTNDRAYVAVQIYEFISTWPSTIRASGSIMIHSENTLKGPIRMETRTSTAIP